MGTISRKLEKGSSETIRLGERYMVLNVKWIVGFVDGERCFRMAKKKEEIKLGVQVLTEFTVVRH